MRYGVKYLPQGAIPQDLSMRIKMSNAPKPQTEKTVQTITEPTPCSSVFAGYSSDGDVDSKPGGGPNAVLFTCGASGGATITAHGIFCDTDTFDWSVASLIDGVSSTSTMAGTVVSGNPTVALSWGSDPCSTSTNNYSVSLRKNGSPWGTAFTITTPDAGGCADMATMPSGFTTYSPTSASDVHFDITMNAGFTGLTPADLTWTFQDLTGSGFTPPTVTADGPNISDGFTIHTDPSLDGGDLYGSAWNFSFTVGGVANCQSASHYSDSLTLNPLVGSSNNVTDVGNLENPGPIFGGGWDNAFTVDHAGTNWEFDCGATIPSVGAVASVQYIWSVSSGGDPDYDVFDNGGNMNGGVYNDTTGTGLVLTGSARGGADPITVSIQVVSNDYGTTVPRTYPAMTIQSV